MAKIETHDHATRRGKMDKKSNTVYRTRNGKEHAYEIHLSTNPPSKAQKAHRALFGKVTTLVNAIMADPVQAAEWDAKRIAYNQSFSAGDPAKRYTTTRSYAHFVLTEQLSAKRRRRTPIEKALPKGFKMHIKPFGKLSTTELYEILKARFEVFYSEQNCRYQDMDGIDYKAIHLALFHKGHVIAYARLFKGTKPGQWLVGRMLTTERKQGHGKYLMRQVEEEAKRLGATMLLMHAQTHAAPFYERLGYTAFGEPFMEADIPHIHMRKELL